MELSCESPPINLGVRLRIRTNCGNRAFVQMEVDNLLLKEVGGSGRALFATNVMHKKPVGVYLQHLSLLFKNPL